MSENTKAAKAVEKVDADYSLEAVPESARKGFWNMFFVMVGFTFFSASMSVGAKLGNGLDLAVAIGLDREVLDFFSNERHVYLLTVGVLKISITGTNTIIGIMV